MIVSIVVVDMIVVVVVNTMISIEMYSMVVNITEDSEQLRKKH
jgi:hypothetical protein